MQSFPPLKNQDQEKREKVSRMLNEAFEHHKAGRLAEAEDLYVQILDIDKDNPDCYHLLGLISLKVGDLHSAYTLISHAIDLKSEEPQFHFSLGNTMVTAGKLEDAAVCYKYAISLNPNYTQALNNLGVVLLQSGKFDEALPYIKKALEIDPDYPDAHNNLGMILKEKGNYDEAISCFQKAISLKPDYAEAHNNLGTVYRIKEDLDSAIDQYEKTLKIRPDYVEAHSNLGNALRDKGRFESSKAHFEQALSLNPEHAESHSNLGNALKDEGRIEEAIARYKKAIEINPNFAVAYFNIGSVYQEIGKFAEAIEYYDKAIAIESNYADAHWNRALVLLTLGDFENGWRQYEWRWKKKSPGIHPYHKKPLWDGSDFKGKVVFLHCEQGLGDALQFIRYAPMVKERGGEVWLGCPPALSRAFKAITAIDRIFDKPEELPDTYDFQVPLMSLPMIFGTTLETVPCSIPYLRPYPKDVAVWKERLREYTGLKVGLVWAGNPRKDQPGAHAVDRRRSMRLEQFAPLADIPGINWFSLQKGEPAEQAKNPPAGMNLIDFMDQANDFADTAAFMENLDLIISVDTSVVHMAGAIGKPVWMLSRFDGCWRWLTEREDSPWYPTLRIFRQPSPGAWDPVVQKVCCSLKEII